MVNKAIYKQSVKQNWVVLIIITIGLAIIEAVIVAVFDPAITNTFTGHFDEFLSPSMIEKLGALTTILGSLAESFYTMIAVVFLLVYVIVSSNNLVAGEVDRGSMAYTLSTPIKREKVIFTKAFYMITSLLFLTLVLMLTGFVAIQLKFGFVVGRSYTDDIKEISKQTDYTKSELFDDLTIILNDTELLQIGASKRKTNVEVYKMYLEQKIKENAYIEISKILDIEKTKLKKDLSIILENEDAKNKYIEMVLPLYLNEQAIINELEITKISANYKDYENILELSYDEIIQVVPILNQMLGIEIEITKRDLIDNPAEIIIIDKDVPNNMLLVVGTISAFNLNINPMNPTLEEQLILSEKIPEYVAMLIGSTKGKLEEKSYDVMMKMLQDVTKVLDTDIASLFENILIVLEEPAYTQALKTKDLDILTNMMETLMTIEFEIPIIISKEELIHTLIYQAAATSVLEEDFVENYTNLKFLALSLGLFLLAFALSSVSFFSSCLFNLSKHSFALGAGLPISFWILSLLSKISDSLEFLKYFTINSLYDTQKVISGDNSFWYQYGLLLLIGISLYGLGIYVFKRKDLPL